MPKNVFAAIVGRPNVGKSSLLNQLLGEKIAIVSSRPQTTRNRITGVLTHGETQYVFIDTPGIHRQRASLASSWCVRRVRAFRTSTSWCW
jgi:GTP-binding protein Era